MDFRWSGCPATSGAWSLREGKSCSILHKCLRHRYCSAKRSKVGDRGIQFVNYALKPAKFSVASKFRHPHKRYILCSAHKVYLLTLNYKLRVDFVMLLGCVGKWMLFLKEVRASIHVAREDPEVPIDKLKINQQHDFEILKSKHIVGDINRIVSSKSRSDYSPLFSNYKTVSRVLCPFLGLLV